MPLFRDGLDRAIRERFHPADPQVSRRADALPGQPAQGDPRRGWPARRRCPWGVRGHHAHFRHVLRPRRDRSRGPDCAAAHAGRGRPREEVGAAGRGRRIATASPLRPRERPLGSVLPAAAEGVTARIAAGAPVASARSAGVAGDRCRVPFQGSNFGVVVVLVAVGAVRHGASLPAARSSVRWKQRSTM